MLLVISSGEELSYETALQFKNILNNCKLLNLYGCIIIIYLFIIIATETSGDILYFDYDEIKDIGDEDRLVPIGKELDEEIDIKIINDKTIKLPYKHIIECGKLYIFIIIINSTVKSDLICVGYSNKELNDSRFDNEGYYIIGDIVFSKIINQKKYYFYLGRTSKYQEKKKIGKFMRTYIIDNCLNKMSMFKENITFISQHNSKIICCVVPLLQYKNNITSKTIYDNIKSIVSKDVEIPTIDSIHIIEKIPRNSGKIDYKTLDEIYSKEYDFKIEKSLIDNKSLQSIYDAIVKIYMNLCKTINVDIYSNFLEIGGDSVLVFELLYLIKEYFSIEISNSEFKDNETPERLSKYIFSIINEDKCIKRKIEKTEKEESNKRMKNDVDIEEQKLNNLFSITRGGMIISNNCIEVENYTLVNSIVMDKCVDCSAIIYNVKNECNVCKNNIYLTIASHSGIVIIQCFKCKRIIIKHELKERIESSLSITKDNKYILTATYDGNIYVIDSENGKLIDKINTNTNNKMPCILKSPPGITNEYIFYGSYNKEVIVISIETLKIIERKEVNNDIFSQPIIIDDIYLCVCTITGNVYLFTINKHQPMILNEKWIVNLKGPVFATPIYNSTYRFICIPIVTGSVNIINIYGEIIRIINLNENVYFLCYLYINNRFIAIQLLIQ